MHVYIPDTWCAKSEIMITITARPFILLATATYIYMICNTRISYHTVRMLALHTAAEVQWAHALRYSPGLKTVRTTLMRVLGATYMYVCDIHVIATQVW